jgi:type I restriction-modification system DNA methylase subunit
MAGVSRGAVSNWRKRADDFPEPMGGTRAKPLFSREAVTAWLRTREYEITPDSGEAHVWSALNEMRGLIPVEDMAQFVLSLACARKLSKESSSKVSPWLRIRQAAKAEGFRGVATVRDDVAADDPRWEQLVWLSALILKTPGPTSHRVIDAFDDVDVDNLDVVVDYALNRIANAQIKAGLEYGFVGSRTSTLLGNLAAAAPLKVLYDPACGLASALVASIDSGGKPSRVIGHDINADALRMAAQRCYLRGIAIELTQTNVLVDDAEPQLRADVIVLEPPFGLRWDAPDGLFDTRWEFGTPPRSSADLAWIQHAIAHLNDEGRAYVITPMGTLFRGGQDKAIRTELVRRGCVEAVVGLPGKLLPHVSIPLVVWVLSRPGATKDPDEVLFVDGSETTDPEDKVAGWLRLPFPEGPDAPPSRSVPIRDVLAAEADLTPQRWIEAPMRDPQEVAKAYVDGWRAMNTSLAHVQGAHGSLQVVSRVPAARVLTVGELIDQGVLDMRLGRPRGKDKPLPTELAERVVAASDVRDGTLTDFDDSVETLEENPDLTWPGDVLVTTMNKIRAHFDETGGHLPSTGVYRLRITNRDQLAPEYLALVLTGSWNERFQAGSTIQRASIRSLEVPLVPKKDQVDLRLAVLATELVADNARSLASHAQAVADALLDAVRYKAPVDLGTAATVGALRQEVTKSTDEGRK